MKTVWWMFSRSTTRNYKQSHIHNLFSSVILEDWDYGLKKKCLFSTSASLHIWLMSKQPLKFPFTLLWRGTSCQWGKRVWLWFLSFGPRVLVSSVVRFIQAPNPIAFVNDVEVTIYQLITQNRGGDISI